MGNDPADGWEFGLQAILNLVHHGMNIINRFRSSKATMIVNKQALIILTDSDIMNAAEVGLFFGELLEQGGDGLGNLCRCVNTRKQPFWLGLNMAFDFNTGAKFGAYGILKLGG